MPKTDRILALDLGMQTVSLAEFQLSASGGLALTAFRETELIVDPAADATRPIQIEEAVRQLIAPGKAVAKNGVNVCLPSQSVFARFVHLPGATADDVAGIIGFEAQQNVPFPIDEVVWDYQIMGGQRNGNWDVALVAIKADQLSEMTDAVAKGGAKPKTVDVAPMALCNAFRFNYPEVTGCALLIDIGARTTNLVFIEGERVFSRSIPVGGGTISAAIAKEFDQDISLAEKIKLEKGSVGLGGAYAEPGDPVEARMAKVTRNTMTRLHAEIARSISFYRTSQAGSQPSRVFLCGGSVALPYMVEFFSEKLQAPIEFLNPLRNVTVVDPALAGVVSAKAHGMGELVGAALRSAGNCPIEINLRPAALVRDEELSRRKPLLITAVAALLLAMVVVWLYFQNATRVTDEVLAGVQADAARLEELAGKMDAVSAEQKKLEALAAPLVLAADERSAWGAILDELGAKLPPRFIWITEMTPLVDGKLPGADSRGGAPADATRGPQRPGQAEAAAKSITALQIRGLYLGNPPNEREARIIDEFVDNLKSSPVFNIGEDKTKIITQRTTPTGETWAYGYTLVLPLRTPILLP